MPGAGSESERRISAHEALQTACAAIEEALATDRYADPVAWGGGVERTATTLRAALERHRERSEAPGGTLDEMVRLKPSLASRVAEQRLEHDDLLLKADALGTRLEEQLALARVAVDQIALEGSILVQSVRLHTMRGSDLIYEAYFQDEGGEA